MNYKLKGEIAGYVAIFILIVILISTIYITAMDIHFKADVFIMLLLIGIFENCRDIYLDYRKKTN